MALQTVVPLDAGQIDEGAHAIGRVQDAPILRFLEDMGGTIGNLRFSRMFVITSQKLPPAKKRRRAQAKKSPRRQTAVT